MVMDKQEAEIRGIVITIAEDECEVKEIRNWLMRFISSPIVINIKYGWDDFSYLSIHRLNDGRTIEEEKVVFLETHPFFCPFLYKTFFIDSEGKVSYCIRKLVNGDFIGKIDITTGQVSYNDGWGEGLFKSFCDDKRCIYYLYCQRLCPFLNDFLKGEDKCGVHFIIRDILQEKIKRMVNIGGAVKLI